MNWILLIQEIVQLEPTAIQLILDILKVVAAAQPPQQQALGKVVATAMAKGA